MQTLKKEAKITEAILRVSVSLTTNFGDRVLTIFSRKAEQVWLLESYALILPRMSPTWLKK